MGFDPFVAIRLTPYFAQRTGWLDQLGRVFGVLGFRTRNPTPREFVAAVRDWQAAHPPLDADGLLGPETCKRLRPKVRAYAGAVPAGTNPEWVIPPAGERGDAASPVATPAPSQGAADAEDRALLGAAEVWLAAGEAVGVNQYLAVPVGTDYAAVQARHSLGSLPTGGLCGTLQVGQVWPGAAGGRRTVVALTRGAVVFVTDSGQAYHQTGESWDLDYAAGIYAGIVRALDPLETLLAIECQALLGAITAVGEAGFSDAVGIGASRWVETRRADIAKLIAVITPVVAAVTDLEAFAPVLAGKVIRAVCKQSLAAIPGDEAGDPLRIAWAVGGLLVKPGQPAVAQELSLLANVLVPLTGYVASAVAEPSDLIRSLSWCGVSLAPDDAEQAHTEVRNCPAEIQRLVARLRRLIP